MTAYTREELEAMTVEDLRKLARKKTNLPGLRIAGMRKPALIATLLGQEEDTNGNGNGNGNGLDLAAVIAEAIKQHITFDADSIQALVRMELDKHTETVLALIQQHKPSKQEIVVTLPSGEKKEIGLQHKAFEAVLKLAAARLDVFLVGPSGSGKTFCCEQVARALGLPFYMVAVGLQTTKSDLLGYMDAQGRYVPSMLRKAYENGGVFLMDEIDAGNPNVLTVINAMLANGIAAFPDGMVKRHQDFVFIAAGNTYGLGADRQYVGRNAIDAATLDRFVVVDFDYDEEIENCLVDDKEWVEYVHKLRKAAQPERLIVSTRAIIKGAALLKMGFNKEQVLDMLVFRGVSKEVKRRVMNIVEEIKL